MTTFQHNKEVRRGIKIHTTEQPSLL